MWNIPFEIPPRPPIVSDCGSETCRVAKYIEHFLHPISLSNALATLRTPMISLIGKATILREVFLYTIDIDSLYTNLETESGLRAVWEQFNCYPDSKR